MPSDFDRRRFAAAFGAKMDPLTARSYPQGRPPLPNPYGGDWAPNVEEISRWGSALRLTIDNKNQADTSPGTDFQTLLDVPFPIPMPVSLQVMVRDTVAVGAPIGTPWATPVWIRVESGVGRGTLTFDDALYPPLALPPAGTYPRQKLWVPIGTGLNGVNGGPTVGPVLVATKHLRVSVRFLTAPGAAETLDVYGGLAVVA